MASEAKEWQAAGETAESYAGIRVLKGNVRLVQAKENSCRLYTLSGERKRLTFSKVYRIEEHNGDSGIQNCSYQIFDRQFRDLSCMEGEILRELTNQYEIRMHADGTVFLFHCESTFSTELWDRVWKGVTKSALYKDKNGFHLVSCRHGYRISEIEIFLRAKDESMLLEWLPYLK